METVNYYGFWGNRGGGGVIDFNEIIVRIVFCVFLRNFYMYKLFFFVEIQKKLPVMNKI